MNSRFIIGIDEAGRGALAGPVSVGAVLVSDDFDFSVFSIVRDSKLMTPQSRERVYEEVRSAVKRGTLHYRVALISHTVIDEKGITYAVKKGIESILKQLDIDPGEVEVRLDGSLRAPKEYTFQRTIIRGDQTEPTISLASIVAKVTRDRRMVELSKKFPVYGFAIHKGYATEMHRDVVKRKGLCYLHRKSFCKKVLLSTLENSP